MIPGLSRVAVLANANASVSRRYIELSHAAAIQLGLTAQTFEVRSPQELEVAFNAMTDAGMQALTANADGLAFTYRAVIAKLALVHRLPLAVWSRCADIPDWLLWAKAQSRYAPPRCAGARAEGR
jgi:hypothetical protein